MKGFDWAIPALAILLIVSCTGTTVKPETPRQAIAYGYASVETAVDAVKYARDNGVISQSEVNTYKEILREALGHLATAENLIAAYDGAIPQDVDNEVQFQLSQALAITSIIQKMLCEARNECEQNRRGVAFSHYSYSSQPSVGYQL